MEKLHFEPGIGWYYQTKNQGRNFVKHENAFDDISEATRYAYDRLADGDSVWRQCIDARAALLWISLQLQKSEAKKTEAPTQFKAKPKPVEHKPVEQTPVNSVDKVQE